MKIVSLAVFILTVSTASVVAQNAPAAKPPPAPQDPLGLALLKACRDNSLNEATVLIDQGASLEGTDSWGNTPLIASAETNPDLVKYLISKGAKLDTRDKMGCTALVHACWADKADSALALINAGADPNVGSNWKQMPLMYAADHGDDAVVAALLAHHANVNATCGAGSAAWWAVGRNHLSTLKLLADAGADLNLAQDGKLDPNKYHFPLLGSATINGNKEMIDFFLQRGVKVDGVSADGTTAVMTAAAFGKNDALAQLLQAGANIDLARQDGQTALMQAAFYFAPDAIIKTLIDHKAGLNLKDQKGRTALMWACAIGNEDAARYLVDSGADPNVVDAQNETAATYAGDLGLVDLVDYLKAKGADRANLHIIAKEDPPQPLPAARAWALAVSAMYTQKFGYNPKFLGGKPGSTDWVRTMLARDWGIHDRAGLLKELDDLRDSGHHAAYQAEGAKLVAMNDADFDDLLKAHPDEVSRLKAARDSYSRWKDKSGLAWDLCRSAMLVNAGFAVHFIKEPEAWDRLMSIAQQTQASFGSWEEMNDNFLDGRLIWANKRDTRYEALSQLLLNTSDANSPWNQNPWKTDLSAPVATN
jgi:ankyrin repeat protein